MNTRQAPRPDLLADVEVWADDRLFATTDLGHALRMSRALAAKGARWRLVHHSSTFAESGGLA